MSTSDRRHHDGHPVQHVDETLIVVLSLPCLSAHLRDRRILDATRFLEGNPDSDSEDSPTAITFVNGQLAVEPETE